MELITKFFGAIGNFWTNSKNNPKNKIFIGAKAQLNTNKFQVIILGITKCNDYQNRV